jgi:D-arginine dehydrogenase
MAVVPLPDVAGAMNWPLVGDVGETWYCKPQSGKLIVSPADATPVDPHDAYADDMTLAEGIDRFQQGVDYEVTRVERTWGGLRSFVPDGNPVVGYDKDDDGFFWLIGQGGYGIQSSPALSRLAAALVRREKPPSDIMDEGLVLGEISPSYPSLPLRASPRHEGGIPATPPAPPPLSPSACSCCRGSAPAGSSRSRPARPSRRGCDALAGLR